MERKPLYNQNLQGIYSSSQIIVSASNVLSSTDLVGPSNRQQNPDSESMSNEIKELIRNIDHMNVGESNESELQHGTLQVVSSQNQAGQQGQAINGLIRNIDQTNRGELLQYHGLPVQSVVSSQNQIGQQRPSEVREFHNNDEIEDVEDVGTRIPAYLGETSFLSISREDMEILRTPYENREVVGRRRRGFLLNNRNSLVHRRMQRRDGISGRSQLHVTLSNHTSPMLRNFINRHRRYISPLIASGRVNLHVPEG